MIDSVFVTSSYYMNELPDWLTSFNRSGLINSYFGRTWDRALPESAYATVDRDNVPYEFGGGLGGTFPHPITGEDRTRITGSYYEALMTSPFGNEITAAIARDAITAEKLGQRGVLDLLCVGFSANDYVGHDFGPQSQEVFDMTVQTDRILAELFGFIDKSIGLENCVLVLTSDHGVAPIPEYILAHVPGTDVRRVGARVITDFCNAALSKAFGRPATGSWIMRNMARNIYLDHQLIASMNLDTRVVAGALADSLAQQQPVMAAFSTSQLMTLADNSPTGNKMQRSLFRQRSGDVVYALRPFYLEDEDPMGTGHGQPYAYDSHVPLIIAGPGIRHGTYANEASPADIAPTLSVLLGVEFPAICEGRVLLEALATP